MQRHFVRCGCKFICISRMNLVLLNLPDRGASLNAFKAGRQAGFNQFSDKLTTAMHEVPLLIT